MFILAFFIGFLSALILVGLLYLVLRQIIFKYGKVLRQTVENEINKLQDHTIDDSQIIFPNNEKEAFEKEGTTIDDILK